MWGGECQVKEPEKLIVIILKIKLLREKIEGVQYAS